MARLTIRLLGPFEVAIDGQSVTAFESDKVRGLLAYLATEANEPHRRESLAALFWPEMPENQARTNLRGALADLRRHIADRDAEPPFLEITRQTIQFNVDSDSWIDVLAFSELTQGGAIREQTILELEKAASLYRGSFLEGFSIADSAGFEEWAVVTREQFARDALLTLERLTGFHQEAGAYQTALRFAWRHVDLDPMSDGAHRQVIQLLALNGQRAAALEQFEVYRQMLEGELGVSPSDETLELVARVRSGEIKSQAKPKLDRTVRGYELREIIGEGNFGSVYRAYQPLVGRDVAVKIIQPRFANEPEFIRRFEAEAQVVARVEHLHIAPLFDYWREPDGAYLVMRLFRSGSLKDSLQEGPWSPTDAARLVDQISAGLEAAHRRDVIHRDVKPANILLDEDRNAYLSDFGIAKVLDTAVDLTQTGAITGSPAYISPEQILNDPVTSLADIYSLGVVLYELLTGRHPFQIHSLAAMLAMHLKEPLPSVREHEGKLPASVDEVIQKATAKAPEDRYSDAFTLAEAFQQAVTGNGRAAVRAIVSEPYNPFKGLRPFEEVDASDFFGREDLTGRLVARLSDEGRFLTVIGPSGSGKSSLVKAGLIPALRGGALPGSENWFIVDMSPGEHPFEELESAFVRIAAAAPGILLPQMKEDELGILRAIRRVLPNPDDKLLLSIDQFEELFTLVADETERRDFISALATAVGEPEGQLRLIVTLRADFYDRPLQYPRFGELIRQSTEVVLPLSSEELERAIVSPLERVGVHPTGEVVAAIVGEVGGQPGALPLTQYALTELFEHRKADEVSMETYQAIDGVTGALGRRAEALFEAFDDSERRAAREILLRLVHPGEGVPDTRRRVLRPELHDIQIEREAIEATLDQFGAHRLLTFDRDPETRLPTVELAHEALIREWRRFRTWIENSRESLRLERQLRSAAEEWERADRDPGFLLRGTRLDQIARWAEEGDLALDQLESSYLQVSLAERKARETAEAARQAQEAALERRALRRLRALVAVLAVAAVGATALSAVALSSQRTAEAETRARSTQQSIAESESVARSTQQSIAESETLARATQQSVAEQNAEEALQQARIAFSRELAGSAVANLRVDPERSLLLALAAAHETHEFDGTVLPEVVSALHQALQASRTRLVLNPAGAAAYSPNGASIVTAGPDEAARIWDVATGKLESTLVGHSDTVTNAAFNPEGDRLVTASSDGTAIVWDLESGEQELVLRGHTDGLISPAFSPDGSLIVTTSFDATARLWDSRTGEQLVSLLHSGPTAGPHFSPDGSRVAIADDTDAVARIWDVRTGEEVLTLLGHAEGLNEVAYSPDGLKLATASSDLSAKLWDAESGEELDTLEGHTGWLFTVEFSPDGAYVITGSQDGTAKVWDAASGKELMTLAGHSGGVGEVDVSPDGDFVLTAGEDGTARVWDITREGSRDWLTLAGHNDTVLEVALSPDGTRAATASWDQTAKLWDTGTGELLNILEGHTDQLGGVGFSPDGSLLATASYDGTARIWETASGRELNKLIGHKGPVTGIAFSPDGKMLATGGLDGTARLWELLSGEELHTLSGHDDWVFRVAFSPDGSTLATASWDGTAKLWDMGTVEELITLASHRGPVTSVGYSADGMQLVTGSFDSEPRTWDLVSLLGAGATSDTEESLVLTGHSGIVWDAAFSPDGSQIASASFDNTVKLWDSFSGEELLSLSAPEAVAFANVAFSPDGNLLAASTGDGTVRIFILPVEDLIDLAHDRVTRSLTETECRQYLHADACPTES